MPANPCTSVKDWAPLLARAQHAAMEIQRAKHVTVVHHIDADGMSAAAIAARALEAIEKPYATLACRSLDELHKQLIQEAEGLLWFCDFGSTTYMEFTQEMVVCDHHELVRNGKENDFPHVNPLLDDLPGDGISGAGCTYLVAKELGCPELLPLALVGAAGDIQDRDGFHGLNQEFVQEGVKNQWLEVQEDLRFFGPETRPLGKYLSLHQQPSIPGLSRPRDVEIFLQPLGIDDPNLMWSQLTDKQQTVVRSAIVNRYLDCGVRPEDIHNLMGEVIRICGEKPQSPTREIKEFATLLNSTARYDEADIGLKVAMGDRGEAYSEALDLRNHHKRYLMKSLDVFSRLGITQDPECCWIDVQDQVRDTVLGIVCGMALNTLPQDRPLIAFATNPEGIKISSRAPKNIQGRVDLAAVMRTCAATLNEQLVANGDSPMCVGGGHKGAAGASIPAGYVEEFLALAKEILRSQGFGPNQVDSHQVEANQNQPENTEFVRQKGQTRLL